MAKYSNTVEYNIRTQLDASGLTKLQSQIRQVENDLKTLQQQRLISKKSANEAISTITEVQTALQKAFNPKLGMLDNKALVTSINNIKGGLNGVYQAFSAGGTKGVQAFSQFYGQLATVDRGLKQVSSTTDKIFNTLGNTVRWGLIASAFANVMNSVHQSVDYVKELDESLTNIMMVTGYSRDMMNEYARSANEAAKALGSTTTAMTNATLVFAQQGYDVPTSQKLAESSTKLANVSQQDTAAASDEITAYMNAFKIPLEDIDNALSKWAKVANVSAADVEELSVASQKAASTANTVGVNMDQLAAQIAAIETVTREAPENIGNGLKTLYARFSDIRMGETLDDGVDLGKVTSTLQQVGVDVLTAEGNMRQVGDIMEDLMEVWGGLDLTQRSSIATTLAGKFQLSRFTALMNRSDLYQEYLGASENETGTETLDMMQDVFENSMQGRLNKLQATVEDIFANAFETDDFYNMIDAVTQLVQLFADLTDAIGGGGNALLAFSAIATKTFSTQIGQGIGNFIYNRQQNARYKDSQQAAENFAKEQVAGRGLNIADERVQSAVNDIASVDQYRTGMNAETEERINNLIRERLDLVSAEKQKRSEVEAQIMAINLVSDKEITTLDQALSYLRKLQGEGEDLITTENLRAVGLGKVTAELEKQQKLASSTTNTLKSQYKPTDMIRGDAKLSANTSVKARAQEFLEMGKNITFTEDQTKRLAASTEILQKVMNGEKTEAQALVGAFEQYTTEINDARLALLELWDSSKITTNTLEQDRNKLLGYDQAMNTNSKGFEGEKEGLETEALGTNISNLMSGIMSLTFAWQSFKSLGSLWSNEDIELGQKIEETIMNLTMGLPMLVMGFGQVKNAVQSIQWKNHITQLTLYAQKSQQAAIQQGALATSSLIAGTGLQTSGLHAVGAAAKYGILGVAARGAAVGVGLLGKALTFMTGPWGIALMALGAVAGTVFSGIQQSIENAKQAEQEALDTAVSHAEEVKNTAASWDELYKKYQETGEVSQELIDAGGELGDSLDIIGAKARAAAGDFDGLNQSVQNAKDQAYQETIDAAKSLLEGQYQDSLEGKEWFNGSALSDYSGALFKGQKRIEDEVNGISSESTIAGLLDKYKLGEDATYVDAIREAKEAVEELNAAEEALGKKEDAVDTDVWQKKADDIKDARVAMQQFLQMEDVQAAEKAIQEMYNARTSMGDFQEELNNAGNDVQSIIDVFTDDPNTSNYFNLLTSDAERYAEALKLVSDEAQRVSLLQGLSHENINNFSEEQIHDFQTYATDANTGQTFGETLDASGVTDPIMQTEATKAYVEAVIDNVANHPGLDETQKEAIISSVVWDAPIQDIINSLVQGVEQQLEEGPMSASEIVSQQKPLDEDVKEEDFQNLGQYIGDNAADLDGFSATLSEDATELAEVTEELLRYDAALESVQKNMETWEAQLTSGAVEDQAKAAEELSNVYNDLLDVGEGLSVSADFASDINNLNLLKEAAEGSEEAYEKLQDAAAQDILIHAGMDDSEVMAAMDEIQAVQDGISNLEIGAEIDESYYPALEKIINDADMTAEEASAFLSSIGVDIDPSGFNEVVSQIPEVASETGTQAAEGLSFGTEIESGVAEEDTADTYSDVVAQVSTVPVTSILPAGKKGEKPETLTGHAAQVIYNVKTKTIPKKNAVAGFAMKTTTKDGNGGGGKGLTIKSGAAKKGGGAATKFANASHGGGASRPSSGGGGGGGGKGGGGKGSGKAEEPKEVKKSDAGSAEIDIYEKVNATLEKLNDQYSKLQKVRERVWGKDRLKYVNDELSNLQKQNKTIGDRIKIAQAYAAALKSGESNEAYGIDMTHKPDLKQFGLKDNDDDGVVDNYKNVFVAARKAAQKAEKEANKYYEDHGGKIDEKTGEAITEAKMTEDQQKQYEKLVENAKKLWDKANDINDVTKDYEDTMGKIRDDQEQQLELQQQMEDLQIDMYKRSLDALDTLKDMKDLGAELQGFFSGFDLDSPFRDLVENTKRFSDIMHDDNYNPAAYYNQIINSLKKEQKAYKKGTEEYKKYTDAIKFYSNEKKKAINDSEGLGTGELAQASYRLDELARWMQDPTVVDNPFGENTEALYEEYKKYYEKVANLTLEAEQRMKAMQESVIDSYEDMASRQEELLDKYDKVSRNLERTSKRVALWQGEDAYGTQADLSNQRGQTALSAANSAASSLKIYQKQLEKAEKEQEKDRKKRVKSAQAEVNRLQKELNKDKNNKDLQQQLANAKLLLQQAKHDDSEEVKWLKKQIDETTEYIEDKQDEAAEAFKDAYENSIDELNAQMTEDLFGDRNLNLATDDWARDKEYSSTYKDDVERTYEIEKLRSRYLSLLNDAQGSSLAIQRQIKNTMDEQLDLLSNQTTMSEYDVKLANARLEILQKQIALENAQQNKNQMKLRRDTQGNYKYVYAADQDDIKGKEQDLLDSEFDAYEMSKEANAAAYDRGIALYSQYIEQRTEIEKKYANDATKLQEELAKLNADYLRDSKANAEDLQDTYDGMISSVEWMANTGTAAVQEMTENVLKALEEKTQASLEAVGIPWNEAIVNGLTSLDTIAGKVDETTRLATAACEKYIKDITDEKNGVGAATKTQFGEAETAIEDAEDATNSLRSATKELNKVLGAELGAIDSARNKIIAYQKELEKAKNSTSALASKLTETEERLAQKAKEAEYWKTTYENYKTELKNKEEEERKRKEAEEKRKAEENNNSSSNGGGGRSVNSLAHAIANDIWQNGSWGNDPVRRQRITSRYGSSVYYAVQNLFNNGYGYNGIDRRYGFIGYDTGGYTGSWEDGIKNTDNGKLAILHQKELVLNAKDTENILQVVDTVRSIVNSSKLGDFSSSFVKNSYSTNGQTIEQRVSIEAEFPNVGSADEIKQALLGLADSAMQYTYREK